LKHFQGIIRKHETFQEKMFRMDLAKRESFILGKVVAKQEEYVKPPLGLSSKAVCDRNRATQIIEAMLRYAEVDKPIPLSWVQELKERLL
jgi:hypothetical protein